MTENQRKNGSKESPKQRDAFLIYFNLGRERSLERTHRELSNISPKTEKKVVDIRTVKDWSAKYKWVERVQAMDDEVTEKAEQIAIKEATAKKSDILKAVKNTMITYNQAVLSGNIVPSASDFKKMWEVARVELGKSIGGEGVGLFDKESLGVIILPIRKKQDENILEAPTKTRDSS